MSGASVIRISGYAAVFNTPDRARDTIMPGAFLRTLEERKDPIPLLWQHRPQVHIGWIEKVAEDAHGLHITGVTNEMDSLPAELLLTLDLLAQRKQFADRKQKVTGLSFGFRPQHFERIDGARTLHSVDLFEISMVSVPLHPGAFVDQFAIIRGEQASQIPIAEAV